MLEPATNFAAEGLEALPVRTLQENIAPNELSTDVTNGGLLQQTNEGSKYIYARTQVDVEYSVGWLTSLGFLQMHLLLVLHLELQTQKHTDAQRGRTLIFLILCNGLFSCSATPHPLASIRQQQHSPSTS